MQTIAHGYKGVSTLIRMNWDRVFFTGTLIAALYAGAYVMLVVALP